jgi:hypothetical protein
MRSGGLETAHLWWERTPPFLKSAAFESSPYHPSNFFDEDGFVDQARRLLALNSELGGGGVRYAVSNEAGANFARGVLREWFPNEMESGVLGVFHVPGDGM